MADLDFAFGLVNIGGDREHGKGRWSSQRLREGTYQIRFDRRFDNRPAVTVTLQSTIDTNTVAHLDPQTTNPRQFVNIKVLDASGRRVDSDFFFIAVAED